MDITLINCSPVLQPQGIDLWNGIGFDLFNDKMNTLFPDGGWSWNYGVDNEDKMFISVPDGTLIPDLSSIGEVFVNDSSMG